MPPERVTDGVVRLGTSYVNWYLVADEDGVTIVDAGVSGYRDQLEPGLDLLGRSLDDVRAILLTHSDADHTGVAPGLREETGTPIHLHPADAEAARNRGQKNTDESLLGELPHLGTYRLFWHFGSNGAMRAPVVDDTVPIPPGQSLDVPGRPLAIQTPGHTPGHLAFHFAGHGTLFAGDALCTWHPTRGRRGPQLMAFNVSTRQAFDSLAELEGIEAPFLLPGHGDPWTAGVADAVDRARTTARSDGRV